MVKIKLPKSLRKVLFPKRKSSSSSSSSMTANVRKSFKEGVAPIASCAAIPSTPMRSSASNIKKKEQSFHDFWKVVNAAEESTEGGSPVTVGTMMSSGSSQQQGDEEEMLGHQQQKADKTQAATPHRSNIDQQRSSDSISTISPILIVPSVKPQEPNVSSDTLTYSPLADICDVGDVNNVKEEEARQETMTAMTSSPISKMSAFDVVETNIKPQVSISKKGQFSTRGEEARKRAVARQKKILSKASLRLDAISDTSLEAGQAKTSPEITLSKGSNQDVADVVTFSNGKESEQMDCEVPREECSNEEVAAGQGESARLVPSDQICSTASGKNGVTDADPVKISARRQSLEVENDLKAMEKGASVTSMISIFDSPTTNNLFCQKKEPISPILEEQTEQHELVDAIQSKPSKGVGISTEIEPSKNTIRFFILLLCPTSRIFELIEISAADTPRNESTIHDILKLIPQKCTDERLVDKSYVGFVRPSDRVDFLDLQAKAFGEEVVNEEEDCDHSSSINAIHEKDVLVAILEDYSGYRMSKISKPIVRNSKFRNMIRRRYKSGRGSKGSKRNGKENGEERSTRSNRSKKSSSSRRRRHRGSRRSNVKGDSASSKSNRAVPVVSCVPGEIDSNRNESSSVVSGASFGKNTRTERSSSLKEGSNNDEKDNSKYSSLCLKLEHLSKKLHDVDDEIYAEDASTVGGKLSTAAGDADAPTEVAAVADTNTETISEEVLPLPEANFKMTTHMMANEISATIEDIFADHDVEIVAVDADDDSDADTFATAQSKRSVKSMRSARSIVRGFEPLVISSSGVSESAKISKPLLEITTKKKAPRKMRKNRPSKFESYEDDDMMLQIEAMARQADAVFESRKMKSSDGDAGTTIIEPGIDSAIVEPKIRVIEETINVGETDVIPKVPKNLYDSREVDDDLKNQTLTNKKIAQQASVSFDNEIKVTPDDVLDTMKSMTNGEDSSIGASNTLENAVSACAANSQRDTHSRNFLDASTSMVSTMVTASQGRVNEVHVLQYLGVTIVCIAANFMQQQQGGCAGLHNLTSPGGGANPFRVKDVLQSAMFLAFIVNGQRYLAKVTKKSL